MSTRGPRSLTRPSPAFFRGVRRVRALVYCVLALGSTGCGDYSGGSIGFGPPSDGREDGGGAPGIDGAPAFQQTVFPILRDQCSECHAGSGPGTPHLAHSDFQTAYRAVMDNQKANLASPGSSRLVQRLAVDFHYCWGGCVGNGAEMSAAIGQWAVLVNFESGITTLDSVIASQPLALDDGVEVEGGERYTRDLIAFYDFKEGSGDVAYDTSGIEPAMDLALTGTRWLSSYGIEIMTGKAEAPVETSLKLYNLIAAPEGGTDEYTVEAWVTPLNVTQEGPARIVSYSGGTNVRNFTLGQVLYSYDFRNRNVSPQGGNGNGTPSLQTYPGDRDLQATLQHVVITYDPVRGRRIYVDGVFTDDVDERQASVLWNWKQGIHFVLGNETTNDRLWRGKLHLVAVYKRALSQVQITQNFEAGVGKKIAMQFDVSEWMGPGSYIDFETAELDDYSYLFCNPSFTNPNRVGFRVAGVRVAVNGRVPVSGQAFRNVDAFVGTTDQNLARLCSVVAKDRGAVLDEFTIEFEVIGDFANIVDEPPPVVVPDTSVADPLPDTGVRDFDRINETMASITGVLPDFVADTFAEVKEQLPSGYDLRSFVSSHQMGIARLSVEYCDALLDSPPLREAFFGAALDFDANIDFCGAERSVIVGALIDGVLGVDLLNQPDVADMRDVLDSLIIGPDAPADPFRSCPGGLTAACNEGGIAGVCDPDRSTTIAKAACTAVLSSAAVSLH